MPQSIEKHHPDCEVSNPAVLAQMKRAVVRAKNGVAGAYFTPWVGATYGQERKQLLILGASHYHWCRVCADAGTPLPTSTTVRCIAEIVVSGPAIQHWVNIEYALGGKALEGDERARFWQRVAYYNYVQESVGYFGVSGRPPKPSKKMWQAAKPAFRSLIEVLKPSLVVVLGYELWSELPEEDGKLNDVSVEGKVLQRCIYSLADGRAVVACRVRHPAAGLGRTWYPALTQALGALG